jgi:hypothetical protein
MTKGADVSRIHIESVLNVPLTMSQSPPHARVPARAVLSPAKFAVFAPIDGHTRTMFRYLLLVSRGTRRVCVLCVSVPFVSPQVLAFLGQRDIFSLATACKTALLGTMSGSTVLRVHRKAPKPPVPSPRRKVAADHTTSSDSEILTRLLLQKLNCYSVFSGNRSPSPRRAGGVTQSPRTTRIARCAVCPPALLPGMPDVTRCLCNRGAVSARGLTGRSRQSVSPRQPQGSLRDVVLGVSSAARRADHVLRKADEGKEDDKETRRWVSAKPVPALPLPSIISPRRSVSPPKSHTARTSVAFPHVSKPSVPPAKLYKDNDKEIKRLAARKRQFIKLVFENRFRNVQHLTIGRLSANEMTMICQALTGLDCLLSLDIKCAFPRCRDDGVDVLWLIVFVWIHVSREPARVGSSYW